MTYSREDWLKADAAWREALTPALLRYWKPWRDLARSRGMLYPPNGTRWDDWFAEEPTQMAIVGQAIDDTPDTLRAAILDRRSWSGVVSYLLRERAAFRESAGLTERDAAREREDEPTHREATVVLRRILERIADS